MYFQSQTKDVPGHYYKKIQIKVFLSSNLVEKYCFFFNPSGFLRINRFIPESLFIPLMLSTVVDVLSLYISPSK